MPHKKLYIGLQPDPYINLVDWSNRYRQLPKASSVEPGAYRTQRTPYVEEILRELSPQSSTQEVVFVKGTQQGASELGNNFLFAIAHIYQGPAMMAMPTDAMALKHSKKKIAPSVQAMSCLDDILSAPKSRDSGNTLLLKEFQGGSWTFTGSNSPASARSDSIRFLILDDFDGFTDDAGGEGFPGDLFKKRTDAFGQKKKIYINSTPTTKGESNIEREWEQSSQGLFYVPCPHCNEFQFLDFGGKDKEYGLKFTRDEKGSIKKVWYQCFACKKKIEEWQKTEMMAAGEYRHEYPERKRRGFKVNSLYSPLGWLSWQEIIEEFLFAAKEKSRGNINPLKTWTNTRMAEWWEDDYDSVPETSLLGRVEKHNKKISNQIVCITAGADIQDDRIETEIVGWCVGEESYSINYHILHGDPERLDVWAQLDEIYSQIFTREDGVSLRLGAACIDSGAHTQTVYRFCVPRTARRIYPTKGASTAAKPLVSKPTKSSIKRGIPLHIIGTDTAKEMIYGRLKINEPGPGYCHFPDNYSEEFFKQMTAEKLIKSRKGGKVKRVWVKKRNRNEVLDCRVGALAALYILNPNLKKLEATAKQYAEAVSTNIAITPGRTKAQRKVRSRGIT